MVHKDSTGKAINRLTMHAVLLLIALLPLLSPACADSDKSPLTIYLESDNGQRTEIATLQLQPENNGHRITVTMNEDGVFEDHFLSMRPFKCLPHPKRMLCHLPYPYANDRHITAENLTDLEYALLFLHKSSKEYGIDAWNGMYYEMQKTDKGFVGELRETDLNVLAAPPKSGNKYPVERSELHEPSDSHWARRLIIE